MALRKIVKIDEERCDGCGLCIPQCAEEALQIIKSITIAPMEVPCCFGLNNIVQEALGKSGKNIPIQDVTITIGGEKKETV